MVRHVWFLAYGSDIGVGEHRKRNSHQKVCNNNNNNNIGVFDYVSSQCILLFIIKRIAIIVI